MRRLLTFLSIFFYGISGAGALEVKHKIKTSVGFFDASEETFSYAFYKDKDYDVKTTLKTTGTFGALYPFKATYHAVGTYDGFDFKPQDYYYETDSRFTHRTKEIVYENGVPQRRVSVKGTKKRTDTITIDPQYDFSVDLLSLVGMFMQRVIRKGDCDFEAYSFNGKKYTKSVIKTIKKEKIKTDYFSGKALKCQYSMELAEDTDAGFLLNGEEPIYFWILRDDKTKAYFVAKVLVETTPFGKLEAITTEIEVTK